MLTGSAVASPLFSAHRLNDLFTGALAALLPTQQSHFGATEVMLALFVTTLSFGSSVVQPVLGAVADRLGHRVVAAGGVITSSALLSLIPVMPSPLMLLPLLLVGSLGSAAFHPAATALARTAAEAKAGLAVGIFSAGGTAGMAFGPLVIGFLVINGWLNYSPLLMLPGLILGVFIYPLLQHQSLPEPG